MWAVSDFTVEGERIQPQPEVVRATMSGDSRHLLHGLRDLRWSHLPLPGLAPLADGQGSGRG